MPSSSGFAGRMVHLALQRRRTLKIDSLLLISHVSLRTLTPALTVLHGRKITLYFIYVCGISRDQGFLAYALYTTEVHNCSSFFFF